MAFPATALATTVELQLNSVWTDITTYVYSRDRITIKRGRSSEAQNIDPSTCSLTLDNRDGRFSTRNPTGAYYGSIGRNTPLRVTVTGLKDIGLLTTTALTAYASTPNAAAVDIVGDLELLAEIEPYDLFNGSSGDIIGRWDTGTNNRSYVMYHDANGYLGFSWTTAGTAATETDTLSTVPLPRASNRRFAVRATIDVNNGASGSTVTFYYADSISGSWLQLGTPVVTGVVTTIFAGTAALRVASSVASANTKPFYGKVYKAQVKNGLAGSVVANPDFTIQAEGATSFVDSTSKTWTVNSPATVTSKDIRFYGEVSQWPVKWTQGGKDIYVPIVASGITRRLTSNPAPLKSVLRRSIPALANLKAYWPMEDSSSATSLAYGLTDLTGQFSMTISNGPAIASSSAFVASDALPVFSNGSYARGRVPSYTGTTAVQMRFLCQIPSSGQPADNTVIAKLTTAGAVWSVLYRTGGALSVNAVDASTSAVLLTGGPIAFGVDGDLNRVSLELTQSGANTVYALETYTVAVGGLSSGGTVLATTFGAATSVQVGAPSTNSSVVFGHVTVENAVSSIFDLASQLGAYSGEVALTRAARLCTEEGYTLYKQGTAAVLTGVPLTYMGPQTADTLINVLRDCETSDQGILYEQRSDLALVYRPRWGMFAQDSALTLNYTSSHLDDLQPVEDDQLVVNDVILDRRLGSSYRTSLATGTLSTQAPPNGIGKYQSGITISLSADSYLRDQANFRLGRGTVDEPRYPVIRVSLNRSPFVASKSLTGQALTADIGDIVEIDNPPSFYAPFTIYQRIEGTTETITQFTYDIDYNCSPGSLWRNIGVYSDPNNNTRYDSDASTLSAGITSVATSMSVAVTDGALWTTTDVPFTIMVAGEVMTVTAVSGTTSPQTFTVTRSVNAVVKAQVTGASVHVYTPSYYGF